MEYLIGQRVILNGREIGTVETPPKAVIQRNDETWVYSPVKKFASAYANHNIKPLPNGQL